MVDSFEDFTAAVHDPNILDASLALFGNMWARPESATLALPRAAAQQVSEVLPAGSSSAPLMINSVQFGPPEEPAGIGPDAPIEVPRNSPLHITEDANDAVEPGARFADLPADVIVELIWRDIENDQARTSLTLLNLGRTRSFFGLGGTHLTPEQIADDEQQLMALNRQRLSVGTLQAMATYFRANGQMVPGDRQLTGHVPMRPDLNMSRALIIEAEIAERRRR